MNLKEKVMETKKKAVGFVKDNSVGIYGGASFLIGCLLMGALKDHEYRWARAIDDALDAGVEYSVYVADKAETGAQHNWVYMIAEKDRNWIQEKANEN